MSVDFLNPSVSRSIRFALPLLAMVGAVGCALPFVGGATKLDPHAVAAQSSPDSLRARVVASGDSLVKAVSKPGPTGSSGVKDTSRSRASLASDSAKAKPLASTPALSAKPVRPVDSTALPPKAVPKAIPKPDSAAVAVAKGADSTKSQPRTAAKDSVKTPSAGKDSAQSRPRPVQLDPADRSRDPNAWSDLLMNGDTTANRELVATSRILHSWYRSPVEPMRAAWPDLWGRVGEITLSRTVDTSGFAPNEPSVLDLRPLVGLRKFRASKIGLDRKRLVSVLVPPALEELDLSGNRLEVLEIVADGPSELRRVDVTGNRLASLRLAGVAPKVQAAGNRLCSRLLGLPAGEKPDRLACKDFPSWADSVAKTLPERWSRSGLPGEIAPAKVGLVADLLPSFGGTRWSFPQVVSRCGAREGEVKFWPFGMLGYDGTDALLVGAFPALAKGRIRPGMTRIQMQAALGKPIRSQGSVDAWATEKTPEDRLWLGLRAFYDTEGRLEGVWVRKMPPVCPDPS